MALEVKTHADLPLIAIAPRVRTRHLGRREIPVTRAGPDGCQAQVRVRSGLFFLVIWNSWNDLSKIAAENTVAWTVILVEELQDPRWTRIESD